MKRVLARVAFALVLLAALTVVVQTGSVPHLHFADQRGGLFNHDHDLTLLAGLAAHGLPADAPPLIVKTVSSATPALIPHHPVVRVLRSAGPRAPPAA